MEAVQPTEALPLPVPRRPHAAAVPLAPARSSPPLSQARPPAVRRTVGAPLLPTPLPPGSLCGAENC